jgi:hypothetical protein
MLCFISQALADITEKVDEVVDQTGVATDEALLVSTQAFENRIDDQDRVVDIFSSDMASALDEADAALLQKLQDVESSLIDKIAIAQAKINGDLDDKITRAKVTTANTFGNIAKQFDGSKASFSAAKTAAVSAIGKKLPNKKPIFLGGGRNWVRCSCFLINCVKDVISNVPRLSIRF